MRYDKELADVFDIFLRSVNVDDEDLARSLAAGAHEFYSMEVEGIEDGEYTA